MTSHTRAPPVSLFPDARLPVSRLVVLPMGHMCARHSRSRSSQWIVLTRPMLCYVLQPMTEPDCYVQAFIVIGSHGDLMSVRLFVPRDETGRHVDTPLFSCCSDP